MTQIYEEALDAEAGIFDLRSTIGHQADTKRSYTAINAGNAAAETILPSREASRHLIIEGVAPSVLADEIKRQIR